MSTTATTNMDWLHVKPRKGGGKLIEELKVNINVE
jgi:hypothetical protein